MGDGDSEERQICSIESFSKNGKVPLAVCNTRLQTGRLIGTMNWFEA